MATAAWLKLGGFGRLRFRPHVPRNPMAPIEPRERAPQPVALAKEFVLRGGFLRKAGFFATAQHVSGATYVPLWKTDPLLNAF